MARGEHPVFIFFIDARDGTAGGRVGGRMSRASMKKIEPASGLGPMPSAWNTPGARHARPRADGFGAKIRRSDPAYARRGS